MNLLAKKIKLHSLNAFACEILISAGSSGSLSINSHEGSEHN